MSKKGNPRALLIVALIAVPFAAIGIWQGVKESEKRSAEMKALAQQIGFEVTEPVYPNDALFEELEQISIFHPRRGQKNYFPLGLKGAKQGLELRVYDHRVPTPESANVYLSPTIVMAERRFDNCPSFEAHPETSHRNITTGALPRRAVVPGLPTALSSHRFYGSDETAVRKTVTGSLAASLAQHPEMSLMLGGGRLVAFSGWEQRPSAELVGLLDRAVGLFEAVKTACP